MGKLDDLTVDGRLLNECGEKVYRGVEDWEGKAMVLYMAHGRVEVRLCVDSSRTKESLG